MRVSIWQQFSSNHSAGYTVVGQFENADAATKAGDQLRDILAQIAAWHQQYYEQHGAYFGAHHVPPLLTPIEEQLAQQYEVEWEWEQGVDWAKRTDEAIQRVRVSNNLVVIFSLFTHHLEQPFSALIERMGGRSLVEIDDSDKRIFVTLTCHASDSETANALTMVLEAYFETIAAHKIPVSQIIPPWSEDWRKNATRGEVRQDGTLLQLHELKIGLPDTLDAIMRFLKEKQCRNIEYTLIEG